VAAPTKTAAVITSGVLALGAGLGIANYRVRRSHTVPMPRSAPTEVPAPQTGPSGVPNDPANRGYRTIPRIPTIQAYPTIRAYRTIPSIRVYRTIPRSQQSGIPNHPTDPNNPGVPNDPPIRTILALPRMRSPGRRVVQNAGR
jgi:hypothetical protein